MIDLALTAFVLTLFALGLRRPFLWVLAYIYIDVLAPQKISWFLLQKFPISLIAFTFAFLGWAYADAKAGSRFTWRQTLILVLLLYCGATTLTADFPEAALAKWAWVWKALVFAVFLPLTLRTRLRIEAAALTMVLAAGAIIIGGGIKTLAGGGGYGTLRLFVSENAGLYEGSTLSMVAIAIVPVVWWLARHGTIFRPSRWVTLFAAALTFACLLVPIGAQTRTGLLCIGLLAVLSLRNVKRRFLYIGGAAALGLAALPFLPASYTARMSTIENHQADQSASTRVAVWNWTLDYVADHPMGGGFDAYRGNRLTVELTKTEASGNTAAVETDTVEEAGRAYHSAYFEVLGEQGWPGLALWAWLHLLGLWQMERLRARWSKRAGATERWQAPLASALQQAQLIYLVGALFIGIAYQPFVFMLIGLQCGLWSYCKRTDAPRRQPWGAPRATPQSAAA